MAASRIKGITVEIGGDDGAVPDDYRADPQVDHALAAGHAHIGSHDSLPSHPAFSRSP